MVAGVAFFHFFVLVTLFSPNSQWNDSNKGGSGLCICILGALHQYADTWQTIEKTLTRRNEESPAEVKEQACAHVLMRNALFSKPDHFSLGENKTDYSKSIV